MELDLSGVFRWGAMIFFFPPPAQHLSAGMPASGCAETDSCLFPPEMGRKTAREDSSIQSALPLRLDCRSLLMNLALIKGEGSAERGLKWGMGRRNWGLGGQYLKLNGWRGIKMLAEQPRPDNLIPIIGFPGEFLVVLGPEWTQVKCKNHTKLSSSICVS